MRTYFRPVLCAVVRAVLSGIENTLYMIPIFFRVQCLKNVSQFRFDIERARKLLREWIAYLQGDSVLADRVTEVVDSVDYGCALTAV